MAQTKKPALLIADHNGMFRLYAANIDSCWHDDTVCDGSCAVAGDEVRIGYVPTNAYGPAEVRAERAGYTILDV